MEVNPNKFPLPSKEDFIQLQREIEKGSLAQEVAKKLYKPSTSERFEQLLPKAILPYSEMTPEQRAACKETYEAACKYLDALQKKGEKHPLLRKVALESKEAIEARVSSLKEKLDTAYNPYLLGPLYDAVNAFQENSALFSETDVSFYSPPLGRGAFGSVSKEKKTKEKRARIGEVKKNMLLSLKKLFFQEEGSPIKELRGLIKRKEVHFALLFVKPLFEKALRDNEEFCGQLKDLKANYEQRQLKNPLSKESLNAYKEELTSDELFSFFLLAVKKEGLIEDKEHQRFFQEILQEAESDYPEMKKGAYEEAKDLAVKRPIPKKEVLSMFQEESSLNERILKHRNLATGKPSIDRTKLLLPLATLGSAESFFKNPKNQTKEKLRPYFLDVLRGLAFLHDQNIIHRDLASRNILVTEKGGRILYRITDFGLSQEIGSDKNAASIWPHGDKGPWKEAAPEHMDLKVTSRQSDVFMAGILLQNFFIDNSQYIPDEYGIVHGLRASLDDVNILLTLGFNEAQIDAFKELVAKMLAQKPHDRPTAREAYFALREIYAMDDPS